MNIKTLILLLCFLALVGCKKESVERIEADKWMHAKTLTEGRKINQDNNEAERILAQDKQAHNLIMAEQNAPLYKFMFFMALAALLVWAYFYYRARLGSEKLIKEFRIFEVEKEQDRLLEEKKVALGHVFNPEVFKLYSPEERKIIFEGIGKEYKSLENMESNEPIKSPDQEKSSFRKKAEDVVEEVVETFDERVAKATEETLKKYNNKDTA